MMFRKLCLTLSQPDDIGSNISATAQSIATNIATDLSPSSFTITQDSTNLGQLTIAASSITSPITTI